MARLALTVGGAIVGGALGSIVPGVGTALGASVGMSLFGAAGDYLFAPKMKAYGPRLQDLQVQGSAYGSPIPKLWGMARLAGQMIWSDGLEERQVSHGGGGGKGGGGGGGSFTEYVYYLSCAVLIGEGPIAGVRRIWADSFLIYDARDEPTGEATFAKALASQEAAGRITIYPGDWDQVPDALIAAGFDDPADAPAYRGRAYAVIADLPLADYGNRPPNFTFEVYAEGADATQREMRELPELYAPAQPYRWRGGMMRFVSVTSRAGGYGTINWWKQVPGQAAQLDLVQSNDPPQNVDLPGPPGAGSIIPSEFMWWFAGLGTPPYNHSVEPMERWDSDVDAVLLDYSEYWILHFRERWGSRWWARVGPPIIQTAKGGYTRAVFRRQVLILRYHESAPGAFIKIFWVDRIAWEVAHYPHGAEDVALSPSADEAFYMRVEAGTRTLYSVSLDTANPPNVLATPPVAVWTGPVTPEDRGYGLVATQDRIWLASGRQIYEIERGTYRTVTTWGHAFSRRAVFQSFWVDGEAIVTQSQTDTRRLIPHVPVAPVTDAAGLADVLRDVGDAVGATVDAGALATLEVDGYLRTRAMPARALVEPLQQAYLFDLVDEGLTTTAVRRGGAPRATIRELDLVRDTEPKLTRAEDFELPRRVSVTYVSRPADYQAGMQQAQRIVVASDHESVLDLPAVLDDSAAAQVAEILLTTAWIGRERVSDVVLGPAHAALQPTDVVTLELGGYSRRMRITQTETTGPGQINLTGTIEQAAAYESDLQGDPLSPMLAALTFAGPAELVILDIPLLAATHAASGVYAAAAGYYPGWRGAVVFRSTDDGETWESVGLVQTAATLGRCENWLTDADPNVIDRANVLTVRLQSGTLESVTDQAFLAEQNAAVVGAEIITFRDATLVGENLYEVSYLGRGRLGTEGAIDAHGANERFVLLNSALTELALPADERGNAMLLRAVTIGARLEAAEDVRFTFDNVRQRPYAPVHLEATEGATGQYTVAWTRRARHSHDWMDGADVPLIDVPERYQWTLRDSAGASLGAGEVFAPLVTITANPGERFEVAQVNELYGAGELAHLTLGASP